MIVVQLRPETQDEIARQLQTGEFATADDVVAAGLRRLDDWQAKQEVRAKIAAGTASLDRGEGLDGEAVFRELYAMIEAATPAPAESGRP